MRWCLSLAIVLSACRGGSVPEPSPAGRAAPVIPVAPVVPAAPGAAAAADPWAPADAMPVTPAQRAARVAGALARVATIQPQLAVVRELAMPTPVPADAQAFAAAYGATLAKRFPGVDLGAVAAGVPRGDHGKVFVRVDVAKVFIVDGADDASAIEALARGTRIQ